MEIVRTKPIEEVEISTEERIKQLEQENQELRKSLESEQLSNQMNSQAIAELSVFIAMGGM